MITLKVQSYIAYLKDWCCISWGYTQGQKTGLFVVHLGSFRVRLCRNCSLASAGLKLESSQLRSSTLTNR